MRILTASVIDEQAYIWIESSQSLSTISVLTIRSYNTGPTTKDLGEDYISTIFFNDGTYVFHVYLHSVTNQV